MARGTIRNSIRNIIIKELWHFSKKEGDTAETYKSYSVPTEIIVELADNLTKKLLKLKKET